MNKITLLILFLVCFSFDFLLASWEKSILPKINDKRKIFLKNNNHLHTRLLTFAGDKKIKEERTTLYFLNSKTMVMYFHLFGRENKINTFLVRGKKGWLYNQDLRFPLHVSLSTRVSGQVNLNDFLNIDYTKDYEIKEATGGLNKWTLKLKGKRRGLAYPYIELSGEHYSLHEAIYLDSRQKPIKKIAYQKKTINKVVVEEYILYDLLFDSSKRYEYRIDELKKHSFGEIYFSPNYLSRFYELTKF